MFGDLTRIGMRHRGQTGCKSRALPLSGRVGAVQCTLGSTTVSMTKPPTTSTPLLTLLASDYKRQFPSNRNSSPECHRPLNFDNRKTDKAHATISQKHLKAIEGSYENISVHLNTPKITAVRYFKR
ncbi:hypothetical protein ACJJTC_016465 [Scirpophaga incertulas]